MRLLADTHVHLYPEFPLASVFAHALGNLAPGTDDRAAIFLAERAGEHGYRGLVAGEVALPDGWRVDEVAGGGAAWLVNDTQERLLVVPGRQFVSAERIEVLGLGRDLDEPDGAPAAGLLDAIRSAGGVPVLPWSPGKWLGARGRIVSALAAGAEPGTLLIGDIAMRPRFLPPPAPMRAAAARGLGLLAGTDPLPLPGDEAVIGRYGVAIPFDPDRPLEGLLAELSRPSPRCEVVGRRAPLPESLRRWLALRRRRGLG